MNKPPDGAIALFGSFPVSLFCDVVKVYEKKYPKSECLDGYHPLSKQLGATLMIVPKGSVK